MPLFDYECQNCSNEFEAFRSLAEYDKPVPCPDCGGGSQKIMTVGGIQDDHPVWLDRSVIGQLQDTDDPATRPVTTRTEYNRLLKDTGAVAD